jgi:hypothetical protein
MSDEQNGHGLSRLDRIERAIESLGDEFRDEHRRLLTAQILLTDRLDKLAKSQQELFDAQKQTNENLNALILTVDDLIRKPPA